MGSRKVWTESILSFFFNDDLPNTTFRKINQWERISEARNIEMGVSDGIANNFMLTITAPVMFYYIHKLLPTKQHNDIIYTTLVYCSLIYYILV